MCAYTFAGIALLGAAALAGLRFLLPELGHYRPAIEELLSRIATREVELGAIHAYWRGWTPVFRVEDVRFAGGNTTSDNGKDSAIRLASLTFSIDPIASLRSRSLHPREIAASGASLVVMRRADGTFAIERLGELTPAGPPESGPLAQWLLSQAEISLFASRILWIDERRGTRALPLTGVTLHLEHLGDRHRLSGSFEPPEAGRVDFAMEVTGDSLASPWTGTAYVAARDVDVAHLGLDARQLGAEELSGVISGSIWSTWTDGRFVEAEGTIRAQSPRVMRAGSWRGFNEVSASLKIERTPESWTLAASDFTVITPSGSWPRSSLGAKWTPPRDGREGSVVVSAEFARVEDLVSLVAPGGDPPASPVLGAVVEAAPHGVLEDLRVWASLTDRNRLGPIRARGGFSEIRLAPDAWPVSINAASGRFEAGEQGFVTNLAAGNLLIEDPRWLARPLRVEKLAGVFSVIPSADGIRFGFEDASLATPVGAVAAGGELFVPHGENEPELNATFSLGASKIDAVWALIADQVLPEPVARWIASAAPGGEIRSAQLVLQGGISGESFSAGTGRIEATTELALPKLHYAPGWPEITDVSGVLRFDGPRFDAHIESARIFESSVREARITIEDLGAAVPVARIAGSVEGDSADAVRFLARSPLRAQFTPAIDNFSIHGDSILDLQLVLPLTGGDRSATFEGEIALDDNRIDLPGLDRGPEAVNGVITFRDAAIASDGISATWFGEPLHAVIGAAPDSTHAARLSLDGRMTPHLLASYLHDAGLVDSPLPGDSTLLARLRGAAAWNATLDIPGSGDGNPVRLRMATDMTDVALDLPPPLGKASGTPHVLRIDSRITPGVERIATVRHGDLASMVLRLVPDTDRFRLDRGTIRFGPGDAALPDTPGLTVEGVLPELDTSVWQALLAEVTARHGSGAEPSQLDLVRSVSIEVESLTAIGARFPATRIQATRNAGGGWRLDLDGHHLNGVVQVPDNLRAEPVTADLVRFVLTPGAADPDSERRSLDPRTLPAISFSARHFVLGEYDLGHVTFTAVPAEHGMQLDRLDIRADSFQGEATGSWSLADTEHHTRFSMRMHGIDLRRMLESMGFDGSAVTGGTTNISLRGSWPGTPDDFTLERLTGVMHFLSTDGRLTRLEPGVTGRVFGLLTITTLPRRFILDFSDLFKDGFEYDRIEGNFAIENGHAYTQDLFMESDTARFEIVGRTGLVSKDYDQLVTVTPKISSSLPFVPIWIAQKILNRNVFDKAFAYQYTITGAWDEPRVELVKTENREAAGQE